MEFKSPEPLDIRDFSRAFSHKHFGSFDIQVIGQARFPAAGDEI